LPETQIKRLCSSGELRKVNAGDILFEPGDTEVPFFVLLSGGMEIMQPTIAGEREIATHDPGGFTGEITMISGQRCLVWPCDRSRRLSRTPAERIFAPSSRMTQSLVKSSCGLSFCGGWRWFPKAMGM
jgi:CRP-like cAMP-binding protein